VLRGGPCFALQDIVGKLDGLGRDLVVYGRHGLGCAALRHHIPGTTLAPAALHGDTQFELDFVKAHASVSVACDLTVGNPATYTDDHGYRQ
jgi:hypothetical protein